MYDAVARVFDVLYAFQDYPAKADELRRRIERLHPAARSLLDVGCGTGRHLALLRDVFDVEGVDVSAGLLEVARARLPGVPLHLADMRDFRIDRRFDVITCLTGSVGFLVTIEAVRDAVANMAAHLADGGVLLVEPWLSPEAFRAGEVTHNLSEEAGTTVSWMYVATRDGHRSVFDIHYLVGTAEGVSHLTEHQELGLYTTAEYEDAFRRAGLVTTYEPPGLHGYGLWTAGRAP